MACKNCSKYAVKCAECGDARPEPNFPIILQRQSFWQLQLRMAREKLAKAQREYYEQEKPIMDALMHLGMCLPPKPGELEDGSVAVYIGPLAAYDPTKA